jgi:hypothetical protein
MFFAIPPKHFLYGLFYNVRFDGGDVRELTVPNLLACAV